MEKENYLFRETQRFKIIWIWILLVLILAFYIYSVMQQLYFDQPVGNSPASNIMLIVTGVLLAGLIAMLASYRLKVKINQKGIFFKVAPLHIKYREIRFKEIDNLYLRKYEPIKEYGGWGIRMGIMGKGKAYNASGNIGLQLIMNDQKKILIGTQSHELLDKTLRSIEHLQSKYSNNIHQQK